MTIVELFKLPPLCYNLYPRGVRLQGSTLAGCWRGLEVAASTQTVGFACHNGGVLTKSFKYGMKIVDSELHYLREEPEQVPHRCASVGALILETIHKCVSTCDLVDAGSASILARILAPRLRAKTPRRK